MLIAVVAKSKHLCANFPLANIHGLLQRKKERAEEEQRNIAAGNPGDVDFIGMVRKWRQEHAHDARDMGLEEDCTASKEHPRICICVRKRPISDKERSRNDHDSITCLNPAVWVHSAKVKVDGITKFLDHVPFRFDYAFDENSSNEDVYKRTTMPLLDFVCTGTGGRANVFAYGQTGSGKTHTMNGIQQILVEDLFMLLQDVEGGLCSLDNTRVMLSFFELYGGFVQDLLNDRTRLKILEDGRGEINITGLLEVEAEDAAKCLDILREGMDARTTHTTEANDTSSRSHAICQILLRNRDTNKLKGKLSLVDLAGSERGIDTKSHSAQRRTESAEINTSLLALKECIRALDRKGSVVGSKHVNYRASKLTLILKDCFASERAMTTMIATVSPGASASDHSLNTLRYADRVKEKRTPEQTLTTTARSPSRLLVAPRPSASGTAAIGSRPRPASTSPQKADPVAQFQTYAPNAAATEETGPTKSNIQSITERVTLDAKERADKENELRRTVQSIFQQEDDLLNLHMRNINENAKLLDAEGQMLQKLQKKEVSREEIEDYASELEKVLTTKEDMIRAFQEKLAIFQRDLQNEQELSEDVESLMQY